MKNLIKSTKSPCLACQSPYNVELNCWPKTPLSVVDLPRNITDAKKNSYIMDVRRCLTCGHVYHTEFNIDHVPYHNSSNLVYNNGQSWLDYQKMLAKEWIAEFELNDKTIVEIGCGQGYFLSHFVSAGNQCIGFEPGEDVHALKTQDVDIRHCYFEGQSLETLIVDAMICRHVIEHLDSPLNFLKDIALHCNIYHQTPLFFAEVPMIDKALKEHRMNDFLYEHVSNFTFDSFRTLFEHAGFEVISHKARYQDEVVTVVAKPITNPLAHQISQSAIQFKNSIDTQTVHVKKTIKNWVQSGKRVGLWGGSGKGAAFINMFNITTSVTDLVLDSDPRKVGAYVPGTGQYIQAGSYLDKYSVDIVIICTNWHARDIEKEIQTQYKYQPELYVYHQGTLKPLDDDLDL